MSAKLYFVDKSGVESFEMTFSEVAHDQIFYCVEVDKKRFPILFRMREYFDQSEFKRDDCIELISQLRGFEEYISSVKIPAAVLSKDQVREEISDLKEVFTKAIETDCSVVMRYE